MNALIDKIESIDSRRNRLVAKDKEAAILYAVDHILEVINSSVKDHGFCTIALSGGSTPKAIFEKLCEPEIEKQVPWNKLRLFWGDERSVPPTNPDSNYRMAMDAGLKNLAISKNVFRMIAEENIEENAKLYEKQILEQTKNGTFDLMMLGMGDDGHTASLFPGTKGLLETDRMVIANEVPQKQTWRMTTTFPCINRSKNIVIYVLGSGKAQITKQIFQNNSKPQFPIESVGTEHSKALWIFDQAAAGDLF